MGWIFGLAGKYSEPDLQKLKSIHPSPLRSFKKKNIYLAAGGIPETCLASEFENNSTGWIACGVGIKYENGTAGFMSNRDWSSELIKKSFSQFHLNGHFVAAKWYENNIEIFTDQLGIRKIYFTRLNDCIAFSTRLDWLAKLNENITIDWEEFGSRWLLYNQISNKSFLKNVEAISQGGKAVINFNPLTLQITNQLWHPDLVPAESPDKDFISILKDFTLFGLNNEKKLSLGLSGGIDSRILLALLNSSKKENWALHSFYFKDHPDTKIAAEISKELKAEHFFSEPILPNAEESVSRMTEYVGETMLTTTGSKFLNFGFYSTLYNQNKIVIDGGYGELARRRLLNSLLLKGRQAIYKNDSEKIISLMRFNRADIFNDDHKKIMQQGMLTQINEVINTMPRAGNFGIENWIDLFSIRYGFVHSSTEQARSDSYLINYMPFVQPSFLKKVFETPLKERNNNKLFYKIIKDFSPSLSRIPLVKGDTTYPFGMGNLTSSAWVKLKKKLGVGYKDTLMIEFLESLSEYAQDMINSVSFSSCEFYDHKKVKDIVNRFYREKDFNLANKVDWWLTFETWRKVSAYK